METKGQYRCKYTYVNDFGPEHTWVVVGAKGALHLHIRESHTQGVRTYGGLEIHYRQPPSYMEHDAPSQDNCWALGGPCWHDGSSTYAEERWIPLWQAAPHDHDGMFQRLKVEYERQFYPLEEEGEE